MPMRMFVPLLLVFAVPPALAAELIPVGAALGLAVAGVLAVVFFTSRTTSGSAKAKAVAAAGEEQHGFEPKIDQPAKDVGKPVQAPKENL